MNKRIFETKISKRAVLKGLGLSAGMLAAPSLIRAQTVRPDEITVGSIISLTGPGGPFGIAVKAAVEVRVKEVNDSGGLWGNGKGMIKLVVVDDQTKPGIAVAELSRLARDKNVVAIPSALASAYMLEATIEAERQKIPYINLSAAAKEINERGLKYTFSTCNNADGSVQAYLDYTKSLVKQSGVVPQRVALVYENKFAGPGYNKAWRALYPQAVDWKLGGDYPYDPATSDFGPLVSRLKADRIDFPVLCGFPQDSVLLLRAMREQNYNPLAISGIFSALGNQEIINALGKGAEYIVGQAPYLHTMAVQGNREFVNAYKAKTGKLPDPLAGAAYNGCSGILAAIRMASNPLDRDSVRESLAALNIPAGKEGVLIPGGIRIANNGANPGLAGVYFQIQNGVHQTGLPSELATAKVVYPRPSWDKI